ncbi:MAG: tRNA pseudouridine(55) synthase TruB [Lentisphaerae bacterium]|nr:tRNA pseudouridine(55) synthase TruB [Lentisphaerota bacterium]
MRYKPGKHRLPPFTGYGIMLVDKPILWTSFDVVNFVRNRFNVPKVGHCGTLDPAATGLLVLVLGKFTSYSEKLSGEDKCYEADMLLGVETSSGDIDGEVTSRKDPSQITEELLRSTLAGFIGEQMQTPPMVSAVKVDGKKLYDLARKGIEVERQAKPIVIHSLDITECDLPRCKFTLNCSKGTYVRTLCSDAGKKLGVGAMLTNLRRTRSGKFDIANALTIEQIRAFSQEDLGAYLARGLTLLMKG